MLQLILHVRSTKEVHRGPRSVVNADSSALCIPSTVLRWIGLMHLSVFNQCVRNEVSRPTGCAVN